MIPHWKGALIIPILFFCFQASSYADDRDVTLAWDANTEQNITSYKVYYKTGSCVPPYRGTIADQGSSPITLPIEDLDDPNNPQFTLTGLEDDEEYFFVVTAYDDGALESGYSNAAGTDGSIGCYSGGGGCFISILVHE